MKSLRFYIILLLAFNASVFAVQGDLNGDGVVDIADLTRINAMILNRTGVTTEADLNFDGTVDSTDHDMLLAAIRGLEPLPAKVECSINYEEFPSPISGEGFSVKLPYASDLGKVSVTSFDALPNPPSKSLHCLTKPLVFHNLPRNYDDPEIALELPKEAVSPALLVGTYIAANGDSSPFWQYRIVTLDDEDESLSIENGKLVWRPAVRISSVQTEVPLMVSVIQGKAKTRADIPLDEGAFRQCGSGEGYVKYRTEHFTIMDLNQKVDTARYLAILLEASYVVFGEMGFKQNFNSKWGNQYINVTILDQNAVSSKMVHACVPPTLYGAPTLRINPLDFAKVMSSVGDFIRSDEAAMQLIETAKSKSDIVETEDFKMRAESARKELAVTYVNAIANSIEFSQITSSVVSGLAYYHFYYYRDNLDITWLNEMCAGTLELYVYVFMMQVCAIPLLDPSVFLPFGVPFIGLAPSTGGYAENAVVNALSPQLHGRGLMPFAQWLDGKLLHEKGQVCQWLPLLFSSNGYRTGDGVEAIREALSSFKLSQALPELYGEYIRECFTWGENAGTVYTENIAQENLFSMMESLKAGKMPERENYDDDKRPWVIMERLYDMQQADKFTSQSPHWLEEVGSDSGNADEAPGFAATYSFQVPDLTTATFMFRLNKFPGTFDFETQQFINSGLYVMAKNIKNMDIFACYYDPNARNNVGLLPGWVCNPPEAVVFDENKENCMMVFDMSKICPAVYNKDTKSWADRNFGICIVNSHISNSSTSPTVELAVGFEGPVVFKNSVNKSSWKLTDPNNGIAACEIHTTELSVSPLDKTLFIGATTERYRANTEANEWDYGTVSIGIPKNDPPKELKFNLTAELTNIPREMGFWEEAGYYVQLVATGKYFVTVSRYENGRLVSQDYDSSGLGTTHIDGNIRGKLFTAAELAPVWKPSAVPLPPDADPNGSNLVKCPSNLNITLSGYDAKALYYVLQIDAEYDILEIRGHVAEDGKIVGKTTNGGKVNRTFTGVMLNPLQLF